MKLEHKDYAAEYANQEELALLQREVAWLGKRHREIVLLHYYHNKKLKEIAELPQGIFSRFGKDYDQEGIELSGGQGQKIAIARALYKKASMVILDEPASALDPIAEAEIYEKFNGLVEDKTAIYISHRMSSSVFCDRILIIDGGTVVDYDTHENLMKKTESLYYRLFQSQAENYRVEPA